MSEQDVRRFMNALVTDAALRQEAEALEATDSEEAAAGLLGLALENGYSFTRDELRAFVGDDSASAPPSGSKEIGAEELDRVAGGIGLLLPAIQKVREAAARSPSDTRALGFQNVLKKV